MKGKIIVLIAILFLLPKIAGAQFLNIDGPSLYIGAYIEQNGLRFIETNDPAQKLVQEAMAKVIAQQYGGQSASELQSRMASDSSFKLQFIMRVTQEAANGLERLRTSGSGGNNNSNTNRDSTDPTNENFRIVPVECFGDGNVIVPPNAENFTVKDYGWCGWRDLIALVNRVLKFMVFIAASLATIAFAYAGFLYMTAFGNSGKIEQAHGIFTKTLIGIFFVLVGWLLVATIIKVLGVNEKFDLLDMSGLSK